MARYKKDEKGRYYTTQDMTGPRPNSPSGKFNWRGTLPSSTRGWGYTLEQLEAWWAEGRIATKRDGTPRMDGLIVYLDEKAGQAHRKRFWQDSGAGLRILVTSVTWLSNPKPEAFAGAGYQSQQQPWRSRGRFLRWQWHHGGRGREAWPQMDRHRPGQVWHPHHTQTVDPSPARD